MEKQLLQYLIKIAGTNEVRDALKVVEQSIDGTGDAATGSTDKLDGLSSKITSILTGFATFGAVVSVARKALAEFNEENERAGRLLADTTAAMGRLSQISGGDLGRFQELKDAATRTRAEAGVGASEAAGLQFTLASLGLEDQREFFAKFFGITDPSRLAEAAKTLQVAFGEGQTGGIRDVVNKLFVAAEQSKVSVEEIAPESTTAAASAKEIGGSDVETLAALSVLTNAMKSSRVAGTRIRAFADTMIRQGLSGGLMSGAQQIQGMGMDSTALLEFMGSTEAFQAYNALLGNKGQISDVAGRISGAAGGTLAEQIQANLESDAGSRAARDRMRAEQQAAIAAEQRRGAQEARDQAKLADVERRADERSEGFLQRHVRRAVAGAFKFIGERRFDDLADVVAEPLQTLSDINILFDPRATRQHEQAAFNPANYRSLRPNVTNNVIQTNIGAQYAPRQQDPTRIAPVNGVGGG